MTVLTRDGPAKDMSRYAYAWLLTLVIVVLEVTGSLVSGSFALRADVWHVLGDTSLALTPMLVARFSSTKDKRHITLAANVGAASLLFAIGMSIILESCGQITTAHVEHEVHGALLTVFALTAALINWMQHTLLRSVQRCCQTAAHKSYHFHIVMDFSKNVLLPLLGIGIAAHLVTDRADSYAALCIGMLMIVRSLILFMRMQAL